MLTLDHLISQLRIGLVVASIEGIIIKSNPAFDEIFSRRNVKNIFDLLEANPEVLKCIKNAITHKGSYSLWAHDLVVQSGKKRAMDLEVFPLTSDNGVNMEGVIVLFFDRSSGMRITEQSKQNDRIHYLSTLTAGLAHEIKNPLSGIIGASQLLGASLGANEELKEYATMIEHEASRVDRLLGSLIRISKPRKLDKKPVNINKILHNIVLLQETRTRLHIDFNEDFDPSLPEIMGDEENLAQVFLNLIKNAIEAIPHDGKIIVRSKMQTDYTLKQGEKKKKMIEVVIEDTGCGMTEIELANLFVPFFTTKSEGTGLGLAVSYQIIEEHEGQLRVTSELGKGSCFSVLLPI